jgi:uncharacterized LabA/DUF88 family protein
MAERVVLLLDGGFVRRKLKDSLRHRPTAPDVMTMCKTILAKDAVKDMTLFRIYWYDAEPVEGTVTNPISRAKTDLAKTQEACCNRALLQALEFQPHVAVRRGKTVIRNWKLGPRAVKEITRAPRVVVERDLVPDIGQKGVDMRIGLDIAWISLKRIADVIVLVAGDSDFVPAMKFARREGLRVYLETLGHGVYPEVKAHSDLVL